MSCPMVATCTQAVCLALIDHPRGMQVRTCAAVMLQAANDPNGNGGQRTLRVCTLLEVQSQVTWASGSHQVRLCGVLAALLAAARRTGNQLSGPLPADWAPALETADIRLAGNRRLTGRVPDAWLQLVRSDTFAVRANKVDLTGCSGLDEQRIGDRYTYDMLRLRRGAL